MCKLDVKEGQTYVCKRNDFPWWTLNKEYKVVFDKSHELEIIDDEGDSWYITQDLLNNVFKLQEKTFDLNELTLEQLREYVDLLENKENAERSITEFIERMSK